MNPIETSYKGYKFKSRLEYRWAVFFDSIGVSWFYEYEGFDLGDIWYLPDFYIPKWNCYFEAKNPSLWPSNDGINYEQQKELEKVFLKSSKLNNETKTKCIIAFGGFSGDNKTPMIVFMPGQNYIGFYLVGYGIFGDSDGTDVLYLEWDGIDSGNEKNEFINRENEAVKLLNNYTYKGIKCGILFRYLYDPLLHSRKYIVPLSYSIGHNFVIVKDSICGKIFAPFSHHLFCNFNADSIVGYKPYTKAYIQAKNAKYGDGSVK